MVWSPQEGRAPQPGPRRRGTEKRVGMMAPQRPPSELKTRWRHTGRPTTTRWATTESVRNSPAPDFLNLLQWGERKNKKTLLHLKIPGCATTFRPPWGHLHDWRNSVELNSIWIWLVGKLHQCILPRKPNRSGFSEIIKTVTCLPGNKSKNRWCSSSKHVCQEDTKQPNSLCFKKNKFLAIWIKSNWWFSF